MLICAVALSLTLPHSLVREINWALDESEIFMYGFLPALLIGRPLAYLGAGTGIAVGLVLGTEWHRQVK